MKKFLLNLFYRKLWVRIAFVLLIIATVPVITLGVLLINTSQEAVRNSVLSNHKEIAVRAAKEIELFFRRAEDILNTTGAILGQVYPAPWKQETILIELILNQPVFMRVSSVDLSGRELASSELGRGLRWDYPKDALVKVRKRKTYVSELKFLDNRTPYLTMAVPVKRMGKITGALIADANLRGMWDIVDSIKLGETGRAFLVWGDGTLIAHQDKKKVLRKENLIDYRDVQSVLSGRAEARELEDISGEKWVSSYAGISGLGWGIVLRQKQGEAYFFSKVMKAQAWIIIVLSEAAAVAVSIFMAQVLVRPFSLLAAKMKRVAAGDLDHRIEIERRDEVGELIITFNDMIEKLKRAKARERLSIIGEAAAGIAHEFKNSLVSIKAFAQLFPRKHKDKKFVDKFSKLVPGEIYRWERMLRELSDFSSHYELEITKINVKKLLEGTLEIMADKFNERKIDVRYMPHSDYIYVMADSQRLRQVFINLIINSVNAMPKGGLLAVSTSFVYSEDLSGPTYVEVRIKDTGKGIPREALDKIFEPFHTDSKEGMGLGLSISRSIIEQHGGNIEVESEIGAGALFIVKLPIADNKL